MRPRSCGHKFVLAATCEVCRASLTQGVRVAIVGSRDFPDLALVRAWVHVLARKYPDAVVVSGAARGVGRTAEEAAHAEGLAVLSFPADWKTHGRRAGFLRNATIVENCDRLVAFWDGESRGTEHSMGLARQADKPVHIVRAPEGAAEERDWRLQQEAEIRAEMSAPQHQVW